MLSYSRKLTFHGMSSSSKNHSSQFIPYDKPLSTWKELSTNLNPAERDYVKFYLGQSLIEQCEEIESEVDNLLDIWRDYRNETVANCTDPTHRSLAEPPVLRKRLTTEIEFFVKHIHEQCAKDDQILRRRLSNGHNWNAINYALVAGTGDDERRIRERPVSARDRHGRETPILTIPEPAANIDETKIINPLSPRTQSNIDINTVRNKLQNFTIDDIIQRLRQAITDDIKTFENHVTYVHEKLEEEADYRAKTRGLLREPTLGELRDERNRLEKEIFHTTNTPEPLEPPNSSHKKTSKHGTSRRSSAASMNSPVLSPRSSLDETPIQPTPLHGPLRAFAVDSSSTTKPGLAIDRKVSTKPATTTKSNTPVLVRLGSIKQQDLLKKYPTLTTTTPTNATISTKTRDNSSTRANSADKFRQMVLDCREMSN
ncbi:unnamed protein product [Rotaria magnacalcarata]|uniref:Uncharacterized protein n=2 Tax=Rotaria magnacalcarata TaxID=392030 RepID=A0A819E5M4_9BILA|nr:unnamed protein product [Rotaria magnacalcarata]CAF3890653.1 unnamed protein product [Rotaria magnacalcarata]